jgi:hypothetical protein
MFSDCFSQSGSLFGADKKNQSKAAKKIYPEPVVNGNWSIDGVDLVTTGGQGGRHIEFGDPDWTDYQLDADVMVEKPGEISLLFRVKGGSFWKFDFCAFGNKDNFDLLAAVKDENRWQHPSRRWMPSAHNLETGKWYHVTVQAMDKRVAVLVDGKKYAESEHDALTAGRVGAYTYGEVAGRFRNFTVTSANGKPLWNGLPDLPGGPKAAEEPVSSPPDVQPEIDSEIPINGLMTEYFSDQELMQPVGRGFDPNIEHQWYLAAPAPGVPADHFSIRWSGWIKAPEAGAYRMTLRGDDGFRLFIDDNRIIDCWRGGQNHESANIILTGKPQKIRVEYFDIEHAAWVGLWWQPVVAGITLPAVVPAEVLFTSEKSATATQKKRRTPANGLTAAYFTTTGSRLYARDYLYRTNSSWNDWSPLQSVPVNGMARYAGYLVVPRSGRYTLVAWGDDRLRLAIDGHPMFEAHPGLAGGTVKAIVELTAGTPHEIAIEFVDHRDWGAWGINWIPPEQTGELPIPLKCLFPNKQSLPKQLR